MKRIFVTTVLSALVMGTALAQELRSPDGNLRLEFSLDGEGTPIYTLQYKGQTVIAPSMMGFELARTRPESSSLHDRFTVASVDTGTFDET